MIYTAASATAAVSPAERTPGCTRTFGGPTTLDSAAGGYAVIDATPMTGHGPPQSIVRTPGALRPPSSARLMFAPPRPQILAAELIVALRLRRTPNMMRGTRGCPDNVIRHTHELRYFVSRQDKGAPLVRQLAEHTVEVLCRGRADSRERFVRKQTTGVSRERHRYFRPAALAPPRRPGSSRQASRICPDAPPAQSPPGAPWRHSRAARCWRSVRPGTRNPCRGR